MVVRLTGPRRHWVVLGSFISRPILWDSDISSIRVKWILLNLTLGSRYHFHPESPLLQMIACCTRSFWRCYSMFYRDTCAHRLFKFTTTETSLWIATYTCHPYLHSRLLLLVQDTLNYFPLSRESFVLTALQHLFLMNTCMNNSSHLLGIRSSPVVHVFYKSLQNTIRSSENP